MAIQSNLPFSLALSQGESNVMYPEFVERLTDEDPSVIIRENISLKVFFTSPNPSVKLYMEGLELLPDRFLEFDEQKVPYLPPSDKPYTLFAYDVQQDYYPLIPGVYQITVVVGNKQYYALYKVVPKQLSQVQWELMRDELENELRGLAQDLVRKHLSIGTHGSLERLPSQQLYRFLVILKHFPNVITALGDIAARANHRVRKQYRIVQEEKVRFLDEIGLRYEATHLNNQGWSKVPVRVVDHDLNENRWICKIVTEISHMLKEIIFSLELSRETVGIEIQDMSRFSRGGENAFLRERRRVLRDLDLFLATAKKMSHSLRMIENAPWYDDVSKEKTVPFSPTLIRDARYRTLYQMYRELHSQNAEVTLDNAYAYQWKRTDWLYEMWGFVKLCKMLRTDLQFEAVKGWIFDSSGAERDKFVPMLKPGTSLEFRKDNITLQLVYNGELPNDINQTSVKNPLYILGTYHNKPDVRLDVFDDDIYQGSIIMDFKYRPRGNFWNVSKDQYQRPHATNQLISYYSAPTSKFFLGDKLPKALQSRLRPVHEVWVFYPKDRTEIQRNDLNEQYHVRLLTLCPGESLSHVVEELKRGIQTILDFASELAAET
jgi:hypothetical protein